MSAAAEDPAVAALAADTGGRGIAVTLVLTDVEGSTRMWADHPAQMPAAMARHHQIVHTAVTAHGGWRPADQGEGDAVFAVFDAPTAALAAVVQFQRELAAEPWPTGIAIGVRVGVHAGEVTVRAGNVYGSTVNRCARIRGLGAGGQVLLSAPVRELVRDHLPDGVSTLDLGEHRMKDLTRPEHVHQLVIPELPAGFPRLASLDRAAHNLPVQASSFLGRDAEVARLTQLVGRERLVTVLGFGGMGKTRLALQVAAELATGDGDGVWLIDLSAVTDPAQLPSLINATLGISEGATGPLPALLAELAKKRLLLVLDNLEQLLPDAARTVADIAAASPGVRVLVTSREPLRVRGEQVFPLSPLPVPPLPRPPLSEEEVGRLSTYTAVSLFLARAAASSPDFMLTPLNAAAVAAICTRLDGLPLAIELAAARTRLMSPDALLPRLENALKVLTGGSRDLPSRHQTLRATIAWSYDALDPDRQQLLDRLSIFPGTFTLDAAEAVCGPALEPVADDLDVLDGIGLLVDRSLVRVHPATQEQAEDRYSLLVSIRDYAAERLNRAGDTIGLGNRHAAYYTKVVSFHSDDTWDDILRADRLRHDELHHLRAAAAQAHLHGSPKQEQTLAAHAVNVLFAAGLQTEAVAAAQQALDRSESSTAGRVRLLGDRASRAFGMSRWDEARPDIDAALIAAREVGDPTLLVYTLGSALVASRSTEEYAAWVGEAETLLARQATGAFAPWWWVRHEWDGAVARSPLTPWREAEQAGRRRFATSPAERRADVGLDLSKLLYEYGRWEEATDFLRPWETLDGPPGASPGGRMIGVGNAAEIRMALGHVDQASADLDLLERLIRDHDVPDLWADLVTRRAALHRVTSKSAEAAESLGLLVGDATVSASERAYSHRLLAVIFRETGDEGAAALHLFEAWRWVSEQGSAAIDLAIHCLLERAVTLAATEPLTAARLIGLARARRAADRIADLGVVYDVIAMLTDLRARLGDTQVDAILAAAATEDLPASLS